MPLRRPRYAIIGSRGFPSTYGGFETFVRRFAPYLRAQGADVTVYGRSTGIRWRNESVDQVRVVHTPGLDRRSTSTLTYGLTSTLHAVSQRYDAALVLNVANGFWLPILKMAGVPTVVNVDGIEWERDKWSALGKSVFRGGAKFTARFADELVVDSRAIGQYWEQNFQVPSRFIPYGADVVEGGPDDRVRALGLEPGSYLLVVARLVPENNVDLFLEALEQLGEDTPCVVVGSAVGTSPIEERLSRLQRTRSAFSWLGHVSDQVLLEQLWRNCGLYVHGHSVGGTNPALLQALGFGSPTVALDTVYNREVLGPGWPTYAAGDAGGLADLLRKVLADGQLRTELVDRGRSIVRTRYSWETVLSDYAAALTEAAEMRGGRRH